MKNSVRLAYTVLGLMSMAPLLSACYTTAGAGKDISATGQAISHAAEKNTP